MQKHFLNKFTGNFMFASHNSCRGNSKSRRDDIESLFYIMIYMLNHNHLPWDKVYKQSIGPDPDKNFASLLSERLKPIYSKKAMQMLPRGIRPIFKKVFTLNFKEEPPYEEIIITLRNEIYKERGMSIIMDWDLKGNQIDIHEESKHNSVNSHIIKHFSSKQLNAYGAKSRNSNTSSLLYFSSNSSSRRSISSNRRS